VALSTFYLSIVHLGNRHMPKPLRWFKDSALQMAPTLFRSFRLEEKIVFVGARSKPNSR